MFRSIAVIGLAVALAACGGRSGNRVERPLPSTDAPFVAERLAQRDAFMVRMSNKGGQFETTVYARPEATDDQIVRAGCGSIGLGKALTPVARSAVTNGVLVARVTCSGGVIARAASSPEYPAPGRTYLSFGPPDGDPLLIRGHGFQATYFDARGRVWLWYPGNRRALQGKWKIEDDQLCFDYGPNSYNPVTQRGGGGYRCGSIALDRRQVVSELSGDRFDLASGRVPYPLERCKAPKEFAFDRQEFRC